LACGPGAYNTSVTYTCPALHTVPQCGYWDVVFQRWRTDGCTASADAAGTSVQCACSHLTQFGARFAAVAALNRDVFAVSARLDNLEFFQYAPSVLAVVFTLLALVLLGICTARAVDAPADRR